MYKLNFFRHKKYYQHVLNCTTVCVQIVNVKYSTKEYARCKVSWKIKVSGTNISWCFPRTVKLYYKDWIDFNPKW